MRQRLNGIIDRYLDVQQNILEAFVDREQLRKLAQPTVLPNGRRITGLKLDQPRQLALMHSLVRFSSPPKTPSRYDLWKLRARGLVEKIPTPVATGSSHTVIRSAWCS